MKKLAKTIIGSGIGIGLAIGGSACSSSPEVKDYDAEIAKLSDEFGTANASLENGLEIFSSYISSLGEDCVKVVMPYIPPEGSLQYSEIDVAIEQTSPWCAPDNIDAVAVLRGMSRTILEMQAQVDQLEFSIGANVAAATDVTTPK